MTICEHCGTELPEKVWDGYKYMGHYVEIDHTHERCRNAIKSKLDEVMLEPRGTVADHWRARAHAAEKRAEDAVRSAKNAEAFIHLLDVRAEQTRSALEEVAYQMDVTYVRRCVYCNERKRDPHTVDCVIGLALAQYVDTAIATAAPEVVKTSKADRTMYLGYLEPDPRPPLSSQAEAKVPERADEVLNWIRSIASQFNCRIEIVVRGDGRVTISGEDGPYTSARVDADLLPDGPLQFPSAAICDLRDLLRASRKREG